MNLLRLPALRHPAFRRLVVAWLFSNFGDSALFLTLAIWTKDLTGSDAAAGLVFLFLGLPAFLAPLAGHLADRVPRRLLVSLVNVLAAGVVLLLLLVRSPDQLWLIFAVTFAYGTLTHVTSASASGLLRDLLPDDELAGANGLLSTIDQGLRLLSPLAGAGLYVAFGGSGLAVLTASTLVVAAAIVATVRMTESGPTPTQDRGSFATELLAGFTHLRRTRALAVTTLVLAVAVSVTGLSNATIFAAIEQGLGRGPEFFGLLASVQGGGSVVGGLASGAVVARLGERRTLALGLALLGVGIGLVLIPHLAVFLLGCGLAGAGIPLVFVPYATLRQRLTPARLQGRVSGAANLAINGPQVFGTALGAALITVIDYRLLIAAMAVVVLGCCIPALRAPVVEREPAVLVTG